jgi:hypothetical protein
MILLIINNSFSLNLKNQDIVEKNSASEKNKEEIKLDEELMRESEKYINKNIKNKINKIEDLKTVDDMKIELDIAENIRNMNKIKKEKIKNSIIKFINKIKEKVNIEKLDTNPTEEDIKIIKEAAENYIKEISEEAKLELENKENIKFYISQLFESFGRILTKVLKDYQIKLEKMKEIDKGYEDIKEDVEIMNFLSKLSGCLEILSPKEKKVIDDISNQVKIELNKLHKIQLKNLKERKNKIEELMKKKSQEIKKEEFLQQKDQYAKQKLLKQKQEAALKIKREAEEKQKKYEQNKKKYYQKLENAQKNKIDAKKKIGRL